MAIDISYIQYCEKLEKSIVENLHKTALDLYQSIKKESRTYSELKENLRQVIKATRWTDSNIRNFFGEEFHKLYEKEIGNALIDK